MTMTQPICARVNPGYRWRLIAVAVMCLCFGLYSLYDGLIVYPRVNAQRAAFEKYKAEHPADWHETWLAYARDQNLPTEPAMGFSTLSLMTQYLMAALTLPVGMVFGWSSVGSLGRWIELDADERQFSTNHGLHVSIDSIQRLDLERWNTKGIATIYFVSTDAHKKGKLVLDDWKFDAWAIEQMVKFLKSELPTERIEGGGGQQG